MIRTVDYSEYNQLLPSLIIQENDFRISEPEAIRNIAARALRCLDNDLGVLRVREKEVHCSRTDARASGDETLLILERSAYFMGDAERQLSVDIMKLHQQSPEQYRLSELARLLKTIIWSDGLSCTIAYPETVMDKVRNLFSSVDRAAVIRQAAKAQLDSYSETMMRWMSLVEEALSDPHKKPECAVRHQRLNT